MHFKFQTFQLRLKAGKILNCQEHKVRPNSRSSSHLTGGVVLFLMQFGFQRSRSAPAPDETQVILFLYPSKTKQMLTKKYIYLFYYVFVRFFCGFCCIKMARKEKESETGVILKS